MLTLAPGTRLGTYEILSALGEGGMGTVYRARDTSLNRDVAIKVLRHAVSDDPDRLARFRREAQVLASLNHPNVGAIYGLEDTGAAQALVLELVEGPTLADRIAAGPIPFDEAIALAGQIAEALEAAHERGIVHRDLKPANIKVRPDGTVKVLDFGLAKAMDPAGGSDVGETLAKPSGHHATTAGVILGTAAYMSPEQASGKPVDKRTDIWAFGVVLWEMLTGRALFSGETLSHVLAAVLTQEPDLRAAPPPARHLLSRCLERDPKKRLRDIGDAMSLVRSVDSTTSDTGVAHTRADLSRMLGVAGWLVAGAAGAAALLLWLRPPTPAGTDAPVVRFRIARAADLYNQTATAFAVSPDGLALAHFDATEDGQHGLFVRTLATGEVREVAGRRTFSPRAHSVFWSPDGRYLVTQDRGTAIVDVSTGAARTLCECRFTGGSWNRDGVILLGGFAREGIRRSSADGATPVEITKPDVSLGENDAWPVFLADGRHFLFTRSTSTADAVTYLATLDGSPPTRLVAGSRRAWVAASGGRSAFVIGVDAGDVVAQPFDPITFALAGPPVALLSGEALLPLAMAVSASLNGIIAVSDPGLRPRTTLTWFDRKGAPAGRVGDPGFFDGIGLSSDGRTVVVAEATPRARSTQLAVYDVASGARRRLTFNQNDTAPVWSPDGRWIAYSSRRSGATVPYKRATDGTGGEVPLFPWDRDGWPNDWSQDGRWMIFASGKPHTALDNDLWAVPMVQGTAGTPVPYLAAPSRQQQAQFSPDGRFVAYGSEESGTFEIYVQPFPDPSQGKWMVSSGGGVEPRWSRDGKELFYFAGQTLMAVPISLTPTFSQGAPVALFVAGIQAGYVNDSHRWQVAPDGKRFLLSAPDGQQQAPPLEVLVNWQKLVAK